MEDSERRVFNGKVPIKFFFDGDTGTVPFICAEAPRNITLGWFFHLKISKVFKGNPMTLFFAVNRQMIRWYLPIGTIYDLFNETEGNLKVIEITVMAGETLYPNSLSCECMTRATDHFYHAFKEFYFVAKGDLSSLFQSQNTRLDLCEAIEREDFVKYSNVTKSFHVPVEGMKQWPVKVVSVRTDMRPVYLLKKPDLTDTIESLLMTKGIEHDGTVKVQGIRVPVSTPMTDIYPLLCSFDGFVYFVA